MLSFSLLLFLVLLLWKKASQLFLNVSHFLHLSRQFAYICPTFWPEDSAILYSVYTIRALIDS